jgi:ankyrin repeat protein
MLKAPYESHNIYACRAIKHNDLPELYMLLHEEHFNPNITNKNNELLLHIAAQKGNIEAAKLLIKKNTDINAQDSIGKTPLHHATQCNQLDILSLLCRVGANLDAQNFGKKTPLHWAHDEGCIHALLYYGANPYIPDKRGQTAYDIHNLHSIQKHSFFKTLEEDFEYLPCTAQQELLSDFRTYRCFTTHETLYKYMFSRYTIPKIWLLYAIWFRNYHIFNHLLNQITSESFHNSDTINQITDAYGNCALHVTAQYDEPHILNRLLQAGAYPERTNNMLETPYDIAKKHGHKKIGRILRDWHTIDRISQQPLNEMHKRPNQQRNLPYEIMHHINNQASPASLRHC